MWDVYERKFAEITGNGTTIAAVAAVAGKRIRVLAFTLSVSGAGSVIFKSGSTALNGAGVTFAAAGNTSASSRDGLFQTAAGAVLNVGNASGLTLGGTLTYIEV
jgi:hypothetical protein